MNLHRVLLQAIELNNRLNKISGSNIDKYLLDKKYIGEMVIGIVECMEKLLFHVNAIDNGESVELFYKLDEIRASINKCFDKSRNPQSDNSNNTNNYKTLNLLNEVRNLSVELHIDNSDPASGNDLNCLSIHDLLICCYKVLIKIFEGLIKDPIPLTTFNNSKLSIATFQWSLPVRDSTAGQLTDDNVITRNRGLSALFKGTLEVKQIGEETIPFSGNDSESNELSFVFFTKETITLYHRTSGFRALLGAHFGPATSGNYITLLLSRSNEYPDISMSMRMTQKLLRCLDFNPVGNSDNILSSISNLNSETIESQLNMIGKLLAFVSSPKTAPKSESEIQDRIEYFLENIL
ncbi:MAG: hypothetical protein GY855_08785 [candidate division Zixibacteria bacterium]|nr:hypothetical protein [candidate division Zixibacteria bacterium]